MATIKAGTYKWRGNPNISTDYFNSVAGSDNISLSFQSNSVTYNSITLLYETGTNYRHERLLYGSTIAYRDDWDGAFNTNWSNDAYETITLSTDQVVSDEFYYWAIINRQLIKQIGDIPITTPDGVKLKTADKFVAVDIIVVPTLEEKSVTASTSQQVVEPSTGNCGLKKVTVNPTPTETADVTPSKGKQTVMPTNGKHFSSVVVEPIPDDYVIPSGTQQITENGTYDVSGKASAVVNVPSGVEEVATASAMNALLVEENVGKYYKFTGTTDENFVNGDLYLVESGT